MRLYQGDFKGSQQQAAARRSPITVPTGPTLPNIGDRMRTRAFKVVWLSAVSTTHTVCLQAFSVQCVMVNTTQTVCLQALSMQCAISEYTTDENCHRCQCFCIILRTSVPTVKWWSLCVHQNYLSKQKKSELKRTIQKLVKLWIAWLWAEIHFVSYFPCGGSTDSALFGAKPHWHCNMFEII